MKNPDKFKFIPIGKLHASHADENVSRTGDLFKDVADRDSLVRMLYDGWNSSLGVAGGYPYNEDQVKAAVIEREATWQTLKDDKADTTVKLDGKDATVSASDKLRAWEMMYTKNGSVIKPDTGQVFAFRRVECLPLVNALRLKAGLDLITEIPVDVREYESDLERFIATGGENTLKMAGARKLSGKDEVNLAYRLYQAQAKDSDFRRIWKVGTAQKLFRLCKLNDKFPDIGLVPSILKGDIDPNAFDKEATQKMLNDPATTGDTVIQRAKDHAAGALVSDRIAKRDDILAAKQLGCVIVTQVIEAIEHNDMKRLNSLIPFIPDLNVAFGAILAGKKLGVAEPVTA